MICDLSADKNIFERLENFLVENRRAVGAVDKIFHALHNVRRYVNKIGMNVFSTAAEKPHYSDFGVDITLSEWRLFVEKLLQVAHESQIKSFVSDFVTIGKSFF